MIPTREILSQLYKDTHQNCYTLAVRFSVAPQTVSKWLKKYNIQARKRGPLVGSPGHPHTPESKEKLRNSRLGKKLSPRVREIAIQNLRQSWVKGEKSPFWHGGKYINTRGYVIVSANQKSYKEHRIIMEKHLGRKLLPTEHIHHINGIKNDNRISNLRIVSNYEHALLHWTSEENRLAQSKRIKKIRAERFWSTKKANRL